MVTWGSSPRDFDTILAIWPEFRPLTGNWWMTELIETADGGVRWRDRRIPTERGHVKLDVHSTREGAINMAERLNPELATALATRPMDLVAKTSLLLKTGKALQAKQRLAEEEALMLAEAVRRHADDPRSAAADLKMAAETENLREMLAAELQTYPYLSVALLERYILYRDAKGEWSKPYFAGQRSAEIAVRARIANGYGFHHSQHWGQVKAKIRAILLPRANQLLQLASVQRLLAEALARGERALVCNGVVFWYEPDGQIGWVVKQTTSERGEDGSTLWRQGSILSTNHGRLVVLPYAKDDGEHVRGHTKNGPGDGPAKPRHPDHFVEIPFKELNGDLMIGLFGELPYE